MLENKKKMIIGCIALVVIGSVFAFINKEETYNPGEYVEIVLEGKNGNATAYANIDDEKLEEDILEKAKKPMLKKIKAEFGSDYKDALDLVNEFSDSDLKELGLSEEQIQSLKLYKKMRNMDILEVELSKEEGIKNGDKIKITYIYDNDENKEMGFSFKGEEEVIIAKGLRN